MASSAETAVPLESLPDAVVMTDARGRILRVNQHVEELLGYDRSELVGQPIEMLVPERFRAGHTAHREGYEVAPRVRHMGAGVPLYARRKDGRDVAVEIMLSPGANHTVIAVMRDITARCELERFRDEYVGYISHDIKNPLSVIALQSRVLARELAGDPRGDARAAVEVIAQSAAFIDRMVRELLEMSYLESERIELHCEKVALGTFLKDVLERTVSTVDRKRVRLETSDAPTVWVDTTRIERVVVNFVQNAIKYAAPDTLIRVCLGVRDDMAIVSVVDHGPGLTKEESSYVFDKYRRTRTAAKRDGLGLGLYISRKIVEAHGGRIGVDSVPGEGSTFFFQVPLAAREARVAVAVLALDTAGDDEALRLRGAHVLLVDDETNAVSALGSLLEDEGLSIATATSGEEALEKAARKAPDAIVLDVEMPGMSGLTLLSRLRELYPGVPAVFMTGYLRHHAGIAEARKATGAAYVGKPVDVDELLKVLARIVTCRN